MTLFTELYKKSILKQKEQNGMWYLAAQGAEADRGRDAKKTGAGA